MSTGDGLFVVIGVHLSSMMFVDGHFIERCCGGSVVAFWPIDRYFTCLLLAVMFFFRNFVQ